MKIVYIFAHGVSTYKVLNGGAAEKWNFCKYHLPDKSLKRHTQSVGMHFVLAILNGTPTQTRRAQFSVLLHARRLVVATP